MLILFNTSSIPFSARLTIAIGAHVIALPFAILTLTPRLERIPPSTSRKPAATSVRAPGPRSGRSRSPCCARGRLGVPDRVRDLVRRGRPRIVRRRRRRSPSPVRVLAAAAADAAAAAPLHRRGRSARLDDLGVSSELMRVRRIAPAARGNDADEVETATAVGATAEPGGAMSDGRRDQLEGVTKAFGDVVAVDDISLDDRRGRVPHAARPLGLREDHHDAHDRGLRGAGRGHDPAARRRRRRACRRTSAR